MSEILTLVCAECLVKNQVIKPRITDAPKCETCSVPLTSTSPVEIDSNVLERLATIDELPFVVDFWAPWCEPCLTMDPAIKSIAEDFRYQCRVFKLNVDDNPQVTSSYGIRNIPTVLLFSNGDIASRRGGAASLPNLRLWLERSIRNL